MRRRPAVRAEADNVQSDHQESEKCPDMAWVSFSSMGAWADGFGLICRTPHDR
jgi:hypothetical protein